MKFRRVLPGLIVLLLVSGAALAKDKPQTKCPVMGGSIDKAKSPKIVHQGQRIYFCCPACPEKFMADPEKYFAQIAHEGICWRTSRPRAR